jgi:GT2 family glycosyltransferase
MEAATEGSITPTIAELHPQVRSNGTPSSRSTRVSVDGKFFTRDGRRLRIQGVTYGPFAAGSDGQPFPDPFRVIDDFGRMHAAQINAIRTYHLPPAWLLELADKHQINVFIDVPWRKHVCFLNCSESRREARENVRAAARRARAHPCVLAYSVGNEITPDILRWYGAKRIQSFLRELMDVVKQTDPDGLATYASYPPTEYLDLSFLDFLTFNVYLHDRDTFRRYLFRLQNIVADKPLVLGELGMDSLRQGEIEQAHFLGGHIAEARLLGLAGAFVFSWTDDWHTGGHPIEDWAFGITMRDRTPKPSYHVLREVYETPLESLLDEKPRVSVVVCTYNGGRTLDQCLRSLQVLNYPDYEVIVVDDGSTDDTQQILSRFSGVRAIHQANKGLSVARNVGLHAATGTIVAYTDSDCFADADWLTYLVHQLLRSRSGAVGGPNLTPADGWAAACVAASPGQPTHVLESDQVAEHIPGCNMAFRREVLLAINGFDPIYRKAGDDVDICWRLQQAGEWITFAPGAFVWHHRRQGPRSYLKQQAGYGEAEALLYFKHPDKFNGRGDGKWRGVMYGASLQGLRFKEPIIYRGTFAEGFFQCIYQPAPAHWATLPSTLEWHAGAVVIALFALLWPTAWIVVAVMLVFSIAVALVKALQARLPDPYQGLASRLTVAGLCYAQPLVRSWARYRTRLFYPRPRRFSFDTGPQEAAHMPLRGCYEAAYWNEEYQGRTDLLRDVIAYLERHRWGKVIDSGWCNWDLEIFCYRWVTVQVCTTQEDHGSGKRLIRVRFRQRLRGYTKLLGVAGVAVAAGSLGLDLTVGAILLGIVPMILIALWWQGARMAARVVGLFDSIAAEKRWVLCGRSSAANMSRFQLKPADATSCAPASEPA